MMSLVMSIENQEEIKKERGKKRRNQSLSRERSEIEVEISEKSCATKLYFMNCEVNICLWIYDLFGNELP